MVQLTRIGQLQASHDTIGAIQLRIEWLNAVNALADQVCEWGRGQSKWSILPQPDKEIHEEPFGTYFVPVLEIITEIGTVILEPKARNVRGSDGMVDLYAYPTLYRVRLLYHENNRSWIVRTDSGLDWPHPWSEATFIELVNGLVGA